MGVAWDTLLDGNVRTLIERDLLIAVPAAAALVRRQGAPASARRDSSTGACCGAAPSRCSSPSSTSNYEDGERDSYFLPLAICAAADARGVEERSPQRGAGAGDRRAQGRAVRRVARQRLRAVRCSRSFEKQQDVRSRRGALRAGADQRDLRVPAATARSTSAGCPASRATRRSCTANRLILKLFRRLQPGINPDFEIGRQLTERVGYPRVPAVAGALEYRTAAEQPMTVAHAAAAGREPGRRLAPCDRRGQPILRRGRRKRSAAGMPCRDSFTDVIGVPFPERDRRDGGYAATAETLGRRTAEVHLALASDTGDPAFARSRSRPRTSPPFAGAPLRRRARALDGLRDAMKGGATRLPDDVAERARALLANEQEAARSDQRRGGLGIHRREDPHSRRLSPRPGALGRGRLLPPRLRRRAGPSDRRSGARSSRR